jgi:hypothetical protein
VFGENIEMRATCCALATLTLACVPPLDNPSVVHDLRILAITTDPPEIDYPAILDGGNLLECFPDFSPILSTPSVTLSALVGDPGGQGRTLHYVFTGCPQTYDEICPDGGGYVLATGDFVAPTMTATWALGQQATTELTSCPPGASICPPTPLVDAFADNPLGLCRYGVWFQIGLEIDASDGETIFGSKLMVFTPVPSDYPTDAGVCPQGPDGGPPPHHNPQLEAFDLDGEALPLDYTPSVSASYSHTLRPIEPSNGPQQYCLPLLELDGGWTELTETWLFSAMTDVGAFDREQVGGAAAITSADNGPSTDLNFTWTFPDGGVGDTADLYEITRDGRGGTSFIIRHVAVTP